MRNLAQHPLTTEEAVQILRQLANELAKEESVGDMRPYTLRVVAARIEQIGLHD